MRILFVCSGNAYRSPVAEALLRKLKPEIETDSAGTNPGIPISEAARIYLRGQNAHMHMKSRPEGLATKKLHTYDLIVAMEPRHKEAILSICQQCANKIVVWNIDDPYFLPHGHAKRIFKQIMKRVGELADTL